MTKRFIIPKDDDKYDEDVVLVDNVTQKEYTSNFSEVVDLLNRLNHEVEYWKGQALSPLNKGNVYSKKIKELEQNIQDLEDMQIQTVLELLDKYLKQRNKYEKTNPEKYEKTLHKIEAIIDILEEMDQTEILTDQYILEEETRIEGWWQSSIPAGNNTLNSILICNDNPPIKKRIG